MQAGCQFGTTGPDIVRAGGKVLYRNQPVAEATVVFIGDASLRTAIAVTDADGRFALQTGNEEGAMPGKFRVTVDKTEIPTESSERVSMDDVVAQVPQQAPQQLVPAKYADPSQTPLSFEVRADGENEFAIQLED